METLQRTANRGSISTAAYEIDNSLKLERANSENIYRQIIDGNRRTWTSSLWVKRVDTATPSYNMFLNHGIYGVGTYLRFNNDDTLTANIEYYGGGTTQTTNAKFRDTSAWMHIVWRVDTTQSTEANRSRIYINGAQITSFSSATYPSQNTETLANHDHAGYDDVEFGYKDAGLYSNMYYADVYHVDGQSLAPTEFGEYDSASGIWRPIEADISDFGNNGFYLDFSNASSLGTDSAGNGSFTLSNITAADQATDTPTNNFCTLNPLMGDNNAPTITEGATKATGGGGTWNRAFGTQGIKNGKWYYEFKVTNTSSSGYFGASTTPAENSETLDAQFMYNTSFVVGNPARIDYYYWQNGSQVSNESTGWGTISANDIIGVALDLDASTKKFYIYKNGSLVNSGGTDLPTNMQDEFIFPLYVQYENRQDEVNLGGYTISSISSAVSDGNGYGNFEYMPSGYYAICSKNIAQYG